MIFSSHSLMWVQGNAFVGDYESPEKTGKRSRAATVYRNISDDNVCEEDGALDESTNKKTKLTLEQAEVLEKSFEGGDKLDHVRKMELARTLGLQPKRIAVWFQNRRARWKTKQLENDYIILKHKYNALKIQYEALLQERTLFKHEAERLKREVVNKDESNFKGRISDLHSQLKTTSPSEMVIPSWEACVQCECSSEGSSVKPYTFMNSSYDLIMSEQPDGSLQILPKMEERVLKKGRMESYNKFLCSNDEQGPLLWKY